jgi:RNA polymerase sigma factor (sigma-70 family)
MGSRRSGELYEHLETLFQVGTVGGLSDAQLLERFGASRDAAGEGAFRALVARHGPMVLRVCLSVLQDPHEAEDAFQVTFLALARKAGSIRKQDSIGSWLHGTAVRVAIKARTTAHRRRARESRVMEAAVLSGESQPSIEDRDLSPILHEEVERLPAKYRAPIVLCYLEGMTQDQAAGVLGWPAGTVRGRLARARDLLRSRLTRRGLAVSAVPPPWFQRRSPRRRLGRQSAALPTRDCRKPRPRYLNPFSATRRVPARFCLSRPWC